jgi:hypothetical protein
MDLESDIAPLINTALSDVRKGVEGANQKCGNIFRLTGPFFVNLKMGSSDQEMEIKIEGETVRERFPD